MTRAWIALIGSIIALGKGLANHGWLMLTLRHDGAGLFIPAPFMRGLCSLSAVCEFLRAGSLTAALAMSIGMLYVGQTRPAHATTWALSVITADIVMAPVVILGAPRGAALAWALVSVLVVYGRLSKNGAEE